MSFNNKQIRSIKSKIDIFVCPKISVIVFGKKEVNVIAIKNYVCISHLKTITFFYLSFRLEALFKEIFQNRQLLSCLISLLYLSLDVYCSFQIILQRIFMWGYPFWKITRTHVIYFVSHFTAKTFTMKWRFHDL